MSVYLIIDVVVHDEVLYKAYIEKAKKIVEKYNGNYLVRGGHVKSLSAEWKPERIIVIEFPTLEDVNLCFGSDEYREISPLRERSTKGRAIVVESYSEGTQDKEAFL